MGVLCQFIVLAQSVLSKRILFVLQESAAQSLS